MKKILQSASLFFSLLTILSFHHLHAKAINITGTWNLVSFMAQEVKTKVSYPAFGQHPTGQLVYTADGFMNVIFTSSGRTPLDKSGGDKSVEAARLYETMSAYAGTYKVSGQTITHHVTVASDPSWVGTDQVRKARFNGRQLVLRSAPIVGRDGREYEVELTWERAK